MTRFPLTTIIVSCLLAVLAVGIAQSRLKFNTSRADLLDPKSQYNRRWLDYTREFGEQEDVVVVVQGKDSGTLEPVIEEVAAELRRSPECFRWLFYKVETETLYSKGLYYLEPQQLRAIESFLVEAEPVVRGEWGMLDLGAQLSGFCQQLQQGDTRSLPAASQPRQAQLWSSLAAALTQPGGYRSPWPDMPRSAMQNSELKGGYLMADGNRVGLLLLRLAKGKDGNFAEYATSLGLLRRIVAQVKARHPETDIGLTGLPVLENDEMESSARAMTQAGILSFLGVAVLYVAGFGCFRHPTMAVIALMLPMAWSFGYITLVVGHLNILSSAFGTIVIGLGSDFAVYHVAHYLRLRRQSLSTRAALLETAYSVGPVITTGSLSTALAFFVIGLTGFPGVAELGIVAGGGIVLCWVAAMTVLPAMIQWFDGKWSLHRIPPPLDLYVWLRPLLDRPRLLVVPLVLVTALLSLGIFRLRYDHNLLNLQAVGLESVELERHLLQQNSLNASFAVSIAATRQEVEARKREFLTLPLIGQVREIATCLPDDIPAKRSTIERIHRRLAQLPSAVPPISVIPPDDLGRLLAGLQQGMAAGGQASTGRQLEQLRSLVASLPEREYYRRLSAFQQAMGTDVLGRLHLLRAASNPEPPRWSDLPDGLVSRFVGRSGRYLMQVYSKTDVWDMASMEEFIRQVRSVDADATGNPMQVYESSRQMKRSYEQAAWYALAMV
ncbi:MAG: MMPL family transporter, partial [Thermoguttaceae bacterium]